MIVQLTGKLLHKHPTHVVIEVGGVAYEARISLYTFTAIKPFTEGTLFTYPYIKGDVQALYGFSSQGEKQWFLQLINVNGVGPRTALTVLSSLTPTELEQVIVHNQIDALKAIKGVGAKAAQRIVLELKDKLGQVMAQSTLDNPVLVVADQEALEALIKLGIHRTTAAKALRKVRQHHPDAMPVETLIKRALQVT